MATSGRRHFFSPDETRTEDKESCPPSPPSWIRLLNPSRFSEAGDVTTQSQEVPHGKNLADDTASQPDAGDSSLWYMSPFLNKPVIGYYNRITQSNLSLASPPLGGSGVEFGSGGGGGGGGGWMKEGVGHTRQLSGPSHTGGGGEQGVYSELYTPWLSDKQQQQQQQQPLDLSASSYLQHRPDFSRCHDNQGFLSFGSGSVDGGVSTDRPEVLKPEEYLSGLQTETYSLQSPRAPCGRCTRLVAVLLVLMALAIVGLATALTVSVLTKNGGAESEPRKEGYPVVRASMTLKILNKNFSSDMADPDSAPFKAVAAPYSLELDRLFLASPLATAYRGNKVTALGPGSISARTELLFLDTGLVTKGEAVHNVIKSAERASQWDESDARAMGQFVVCSDCVTVSLNFTRLLQLPPKPVLKESGSGGSAPSNSTSTPPSVTKAGGEAAETSTTSMPNISITNSTPFLDDGHFTITCDVTGAGGWSLLTLEFRADNSTAQSMTLLVTVQRTRPSIAVVTKASASRLSAFSEGSSERVTLFVNVTDVTCFDRGDYRCRVTMKGGQEFSETGRVEILELPSSPLITHTWSSAAWDATPVYRCSAKLGYPPGALSFSMAEDEHSPWRRLALTDFVTGLNCHRPSTLTLSALHPGLPTSNGSRLVCQVFSQHLQLIDPGKFSTVFQLNHSPKLEIQTKSTSVNQGLAVIRCRLLHPPSWSHLTLLKLTSQGQEKVTSLQSDGSMTWADNYLRHRTLTTTTVSEKMAELNVFIFSVKCVDEGVYVCVLHPNFDVDSPQATLYVAAKPSQPHLMVPEDIFQRSQHPFTVTCKAKVGRPAGNLVLAVKHPNEAEFREVSFNEQAMIPMSCTTEVRGMFYAGAGSLHNGSSLSCSVQPHSTLREEEAAADAADAYSVVHVFNILSDALCQGQQERNVSHPTDCGHVIYCKNDVIFSVNKCPDDLCFNSTSGNCGLSRSVHHHTERPAGPCYPDKDQVTLPHPGQCTAFIQCHRGHQVTQHCPTGHLYVTQRHCSANVTHTQCYKELRRDVGVVTNATFLTSP